MTLNGVEILVSCISADLQTNYQTLMTKELFADDGSIMNMVHNVDFLNY